MESVDGGKNTLQQRETLPSQLDSRTFGMVGPTGLWTRYHSKGLIMNCFKAQRT